MKLENKTSNFNLYDMLINAMPYGILISNLEGKFILWNKVVENIFSIERMTSTIEKWVQDFGVYTIDKQLYPTEELPMFKAMSGETVIGEKMFIKNDGNPDGIYLKVSSYPLMENNKIHAAAIVFEDITKEQIFYDHLVQQLEEIETFLKVEKIEFKPKNKTHETI